MGYNIMVSTDKASLILIDLTEGVRMNLLFNEWFMAAMEWMGDFIAIGMIGLLIVLGLQWFIRFDILSLDRIRRSLSGINRKLNLMNSYGADNLKKIQALFTYQIHPGVRDAWSIFNGELTAKSAGGERPDIRDYFNTPEVLSIPAARRKAETVPGTLVLIGALGTFLSVLAGFSREGVDLPVDRLWDILLPSSFILIAAVIISLLFQLADRTLWHSAVKQLHRFNGLMAQKLPPLPAPAEKEETGKRKLAEPVAQIMELFIQKLQTVAEEQHDSMAKKNKELIAFQEQSQKVLADANAGILKNQGEQLKLNQSMQGIISSLADHESKISSSQEMIHASLGKTEGLFKMLASVLEANKELNQALNIQREALQQDTRDYFEKTSQHSQKITEDLNFQIEQVFTRFTGLTEMAYDKLESALSQPLKELVTHMDEMTRNMDEQVRSVSLYSKDLSLEIAELNQSLRESVKEFSSQLCEGVRETLKIFDEGLGEVTSRFGTMMGDIKDTADELNETVKDIADITVKARESS